MIVLSRTFIHISWSRSLERLPRSSIGRKQNAEQRVGSFGICEMFSPPQLVVGDAANCRF
jgi:hypothetical protein